MDTKITNKNEIIEKIKVGLVAGLVYGLVTQIIALLTNNNLFSRFDLFGCLIGLIIVLITSLIIIRKLENKK